MNASQALSREKSYTAAINVSTEVDAGLRWYLFATASLVAVAIIFLRQPDMFTRPQFLAEDGTEWFADAYNLGWFVSLFRPQCTYFQTFPRLAAALALLVPLTSAPLVMNLVGLIAQIAPVLLLISRRMAAFGSLNFRIGLALIYLVMPNSRELNVTVTEAQWHLAFLACLVVLAAPPVTRAGRWFDIAALTLSGLTGPFCAMLLPAALVCWWKKADRSRSIAVLILGSCATIQATSVLLHHSDSRFHQPLDATARWFVGIIGGQVYMQTVFGHGAWGVQLGLGIPAAAAVLGTLIMALWLWRAEFEFRMFALFSAIVLAASMFSPATPPLPEGMTPWKLMALAPGVRYWFLPALAFSWGVLYCLFGAGRTKAMEFIGFVLLLLMSVGFVRDWHHVGYPDPGLSGYAAKLERLKRGEVLIIPENPENFAIRLIKR